MLDLLKSHPLNLIRGISVVIEKKATELRQTSLAVFARHARNWANETSEVVQEIATDANHGLDLFNAAMADGKIDDTEAAHIRAAFTEIREEAVTGKILNA
jgi:uncharacterized membrane protein YebE (DUF533 family)